MRFLHGAEAKQASAEYDQAIAAAHEATCRRSKCGSVIVRDGAVVGRGFNSPPGDLESQRRCHLDKSQYGKGFKSDRTCCIHAEQRAILDASVRNPDKLAGSRLYFIRLDGEDRPKKSGRPYCTHCSKLALDAGIAEFVLWHDEGICVYPTEEYNDLSYAHGLEEPGE